MSKKFSLLFFLAGFFLLAACATSRPASLTVEQSSTPALDSLKAKFSLYLKNEKGETQELSGVLFSVKGARYRLELSGLFGIGVASLLWQPEGWKITFPTKKLFLDGRGYFIGLPEMAAIPFVNMHQLAGIFYGDLLPSPYQEIAKEDSSDVEIVTAQETSGRSFRFIRKKDSGEVLSLMQVGAGGFLEKVYFDAPKSYNGVILPSKIRFDRDDQTFLELSLKKVQHDASWGSGVWRLNIPENYNKLIP